MYETILTTDKYRIEKSKYGFCVSYVWRFKEDNKNPVRWETITASANTIKFWKTLSGAKRYCESKWPNANPQ
jgi:hypothetical protein